MAAPAFYTPLNDIEPIYLSLKKAYAQRKLADIEYRREQLSQLAHLFTDHRKAFLDALHTDLGRPAFESDILELTATVGEAVEAYKSVHKWTKPEYPPFDMTYGPMRPKVRKEPKGVVLIMGPFNFPIFCTFGPLAGAIAAGNSTVIKLSELTPATSALLGRLVPQYLNPDVVRIVNGGVEVTTKILELQWDHILFTGGSRVGRIVATAAAKHLTPTTLELGAKSPAIVDPKCNVKSAARKILWGRMSNAGQVCVSPDYVLVPRHFQSHLVNALREAYHEFYPKGPKESIGRIVSDGHFARVKKMVDETEGTVVLGGKSDEATRYIEPTVVRSVRPDDSLMQDEIFGPVLPIVPVDDIEAAIKHINAGEKPLALYVFSQDKKLQEHIFSNTQSGAAVANEVIVHLAVPGLPMGGVGASGYGAHTGKFSFDTFTHLRSSIDSPTWLDVVLKNRYPPYTSAKLKTMFSLILPSLPPRPGQPPSLFARMRSALLFALLAALSALVARRKGVTAGDVRRRLLTAAGKSA